MRVVADTNVLVSGLLWTGPPRQVLDAARAGRLELFTTSELLLDVHDVLGRPKFADRLVQAGTSVAALVAGYAGLAGFVKPAIIAPVIMGIPTTMRF